MARHSAAGPTRTPAHQLDTARLWPPALPARRRARRRRAARGASEGVIEVAEELVVVRGAGAVVGFVAGGAAEEARRGQVVRHPGHVVAAVRFGEEVGDCHVMQGSSHWVQSQGVEDGDVGGDLHERLEMRTWVRRLRTHLIRYEEGDFL